jgi:hypothetical protein
MVFQIVLPVMLMLPVLSLPAIHQKTKTSMLGIAEKDCAPWDGPAFGLWLPGEGIGGPKHSWVYLRIWNKPEKSLGRFTFPDKSLKVGAVIYFLMLESPKMIDWQNQSRQQLKGSVRFDRVSLDQNILGELDFFSERNIHLSGKFEAKWIRNNLPC